MGFARGPNIVTDGLVLALDAASSRSYPGSGDTIYDLAGSNNGTLTNGPTFDSGNGGSIEFNGTDDYIDTNYPLNGSNAFSVSCWFNLDRVDKTWQSVVDAYLSSSDRNFQLWVNNNAKLYVFHLGSNHTGAGELSPNVWYNAVFTYEGSGNGVLYLNGEVLEASVPKGAGSGGNVNVDIARRTDAHASSYTDGNISTVKIYDGALTSTEVTQNYNALKSRFGL